MQWLIDIVKKWIDIRGNLPPGYEDRGDYVGSDWKNTDLIVDNDWHTLDLSSIVPEHAKAVTIGLRGTSDILGILARLRPTGTTGTPAKCVLHVVVAGVAINNNATIGINADRKIDYFIANVAGIDLDVTIRGWWF